MIQSSFSATPSSRATACPSSTWKPGGSAVLLAKGSELGWAHSPIAPSERIASSDRASAEPTRPMAAAWMSGRIFVMLFPDTEAPDIAASSVARLQRADIFDDLVDLRVAANGAERWHPALLA